MPAAMTRVWRQQSAEVAVRRAVELQAAGRHLLLAGDPVPAAEVVAAPSSPELDAIAVCLLDASPEAQAERLAARRDPPALLPHHQAFAAWMRKQAADPLYMTHVVTDEGWEAMRWDRLPKLAPNWRTHTVDTTHLTRREAAMRSLTGAGARSLGMLRSFESPATDATIRNRGLLRCGSGLER